nr:hypothetical protein GCM10017745_74320 [Saccharothrix mutabilis subsp. capreolus]
MVALRQTGVRDDQVTAVEHVVRHQPVAEPLGPLPELLRLGGQLRQRLGQAVLDLHVPAAQRPHQLLLVVAAHGERVPGLDHAHHQPQHARRVRPAVDQVADEHRAPPRRRHRVDRTALGVAHQVVAQLAQQVLQLLAAAVHVADHVERPGLVAQVVEQPLGDDRRLVHFGLAAQHVDLLEALLAEELQRLAQRGPVPAHDVRAEVAVRPGRVARQAHLFGQVEHDRHRQHVVLARDLHQLRAVGPLHVGRVHHGGPPGGEPLARHVVQHVERVAGGRLVVLVVGHQAAEVVAGQDLRRREVRARERRLARAGGADQHHQAQVRDLQLHQSCSPTTVKTAICVGAPSAGSSGPIGSNDTL